MNLRDYLTKKNLTIVAFAKLSDIQPTTVHRLANKKIKHITAENALKVQLATNNNVKLMDLLPNYNNIVKRFKK